MHIRHYLLPAVALGAIASVTTFVPFRDLIPYAHYILRSQISGDIRELNVRAGQARIVHSPAAPKL
jgi:hypothetical protein